MAIMCCSAKTNRATERPAAEKSGGVRMLSLLLMPSIRTCLLAVLIAAGMAAAVPAWPAADDAALAPWRELEAARQALKSAQNPGQMERLGRSSPSHWIRQQASRQLASHYAGAQQWKSYQAHSQAASPCAQLRFALATMPDFQIRSLTGAALEQYATQGAAAGLCKRALAEAAATGLLSDSQIWHRIRILIGSRKSRRARLLLPLLSDPVSNNQLHRAVQRATATMRANRVDTGSRIKRELLGVSAIVAAHARPALAAERWQVHSKGFEPHIRNQVWALIGREGALDHLPQALEWFRNAPLDDGDLTPAYGPLDLAWRVRAALRNEDWREVKTTIETMRGEQRQLSAWLYWHALALGRLGDSYRMQRELEKLADDHDDYYGILASEQLGRKLPPGNAIASRKRADRLSRDDADVRLALALAGSGREAQARRVWKHWMLRNDSHTILAASEAARAAGWLLGSINAADRAAPAANSLALRYPTPHRALIIDYCQRFALSAAYVYGLIRQESRFNTNAVSSAGARGMMQIMPATARRIARSHRYTRYRLARLTLPRTNVILGTTYLRDLADSLDNDAILIAAAYNAGPSRARKWAKASRGVSRAIMVETIPFTETRIYVKSLLANQIHYGRILRQETRPLLETLAGKF